MTVKEKLKSIDALSSAKGTFLLEDILTDSFVSKYTDCQNANELFDFCKADFSNQLEFDNLDISYLDDMIKEHSEIFKDFAGFVETAAIQYRLK